MTVRRSWWIVYGAGAAVVLLALGWITAEMLRLERAELAARADAEHQEALRLALWRMDSWLAPRLAQEAARPYGDYEPFRPTRNLYSGERLEPIDGSQWLAPSPLLSFQSDIIPLHFQFSEQKGFTSPQAPVGGQRDAVADNNYLEAEQLAANDERLEKLAQKLDAVELVACVVAAEVTPAPGPPPALTKAGGGDAGSVSKLESQDWQAMKNMAERSRRGDIDQQVKQAPRQQMAQMGQTAEIERTDETPAREDAPDIGSLVPIWIDGDDGEDRQLVLARRVQVSGESVYQGFLFDWTTLRPSLLDQISDLFGRAALVPVEAAASSADLSPVMLATIPVALEVPAGVPAQAPRSHRPGSR